MLGGLENSSCSILQELFLEITSADDPQYQIYSDAYKKQIYSSACQNIATFI